jgi:hypothetical protein
MADQAKWLEGTFRGEGCGTYPTIPPFEYVEEVSTVLYRSTTLEDYREAFHIFACKSFPALFRWSSQAKILLTDVAPPRLECKPLAYYYNLALLLSHPNVIRCTGKDTCTL